MQDVQAQLQAPEAGPTAELLQRHLQAARLSTAQAQRADGMAQDIATVQGRDILRREIWLILRQAGLVTEPDPPPPPAPRRRKPTHLSLVE
jgi:hypothetical protein